MRKLLLAGMASAALLAVGSAEAADLGVRPSYKAPPPVAAPVQFTWTGCHIGAHIGGGWGTKQWEDQGDDISDNTSYTTNGFLGGGQIGCDYQWGGPIVFGIEGSISGTDLKGTGVQPFEPEQATISTKIDWLATLTGRVGFTVDRALIYAKGGVAWAREKHTVTEFSEDGSDAQTLATTRTGGLFGAGIEYAFLPNWSAKLEYNFMDFGHKSFLFTELAEGGASPVSVKQQLHTITFGVNYRFNWGLFGKAPDMARY